MIFGLFPPSFFSRQLTRNMKEMKRVEEDGVDINSNPLKKYESDDFASMLRVFYDRVFPFEEMYHWLSYGM